jgi:hypothetical protein
MAMVFPFRSAMPSIFDFPSQIIAAVGSETRLPTAVIGAPFSRASTT